MVVQQPYDPYKVVGGCPLLGRDTLSVSLFVLAIQSIEFTMEFSSSNVSCFTG
jgi:hypothetical protein